MINGMTLCGITTAPRCSRCASRATLTTWAGGPEANPRLSEARALAVTRGLVELGVEANRLQSQGYGLSKPLTSNKTEEQPLSLADQQLSHGAGGGKAIVAGVDGFPIACVTSNFPLRNRVGSPSLPSR